LICIITCGHNPDDERIYHKQIQTLLGAGYKILYLSKKPVATPFNNKNLVHKTIETSQNLFIKQCFKEIQSAKVQSVHIHEFELLRLAKIIKKRFPLPIIYDVHESNPEMWDEFSSKPYFLKKMINISLSQYEKLNLKFVDKVFTVTPLLTKRYERLGISSEFLPNFPRISEVKNFALCKSPTIIYHGQLSDERGIFSLLKAMKTVQKKHPDVILNLYGSERAPDTIQKFKSQIIKMNLESSVFLHKPVSRSKILKILKQSRVGVIPFRDNPFARAGLPVKLFEYFLCGCAVVATNLPLIRQFGEKAVSLTDAGDYRTIANEVSSLICDDALYAAKSNLGLELIEKKYNWEKYESVFLKNYENLLQ